MQTRGPTGPLRSGGIRSFFTAAKAKLAGLLKTSKGETKEVSQKKETGFKNFMAKFSSKSSNTSKISLSERGTKQMKSTNQKQVDSFLERDKNIPKEKPTDQFGEL